jgi:6-pyruvoyltetrahydropterin/6-carboxytetrahydropterin synthase
MSEHLVYAASTSFESARRLAAAAGAPHLQRLHGHSFQASVRTAAPPSFRGGEIDALRERLQQAVAPLDYQLLNEQVELPTDEGLAQWLRARLGGAEALLVGVQSTASGGVDLPAGDAPSHWRRYEFESAHRLPRVAPGHKCGRMHGHGFAVVLRVATGAGAGAEPDGDPAPAAARLDRAWAPMHTQLHHACLNDIAGLENPTSEALARWIWTQVQPRLPGLRRVTVFETATCGAHYDGQGFRIWKDLGFDSAVRLHNAPERDPRRSVHGHSYRLRLHLAAPLDQVLGWTIDFGDVKEVFAPVFARLDHHPLHELPGVADAGSAAIARWIRTEAAAGLPQIDRIDLYDTPGCGVILSWGAAEAWRVGALPG